LVEVTGVESLLRTLLSACYDQVCAPDVRAVALTFPPFSVGGSCCSPPDILSFCYFGGGDRSRTGVRKSQSVIQLRV